LFRHFRSSRGCLPRRRNQKNHTVAVVSPRSTYARDVRTVPHRLTAALHSTCLGITRPRRIVFGDKRINARRVQTHTRTDHRDITRVCGPLPIAHRQFTSESTRFRGNGNVRRRFSTLPRRLFEHAIFPRQRLRRTPCRSPFGCFSFVADCPR